MWRYEGTTYCGFDLRYEHWVPVDHHETENDAEHLGGVGNEAAALQGDCVAALLVHHPSGQAWLP